MPSDRPVCLRCKEDFPISDDAGRPYISWQMGTMRAISKAPKWMRQHHSVNWVSKKEDMRDPYLCGNCYFDLTDERDYDE